VGAVSIVLSGGDYDDIDAGDAIQYCGTAGSRGKLSAGTQHLIDSHRQEVDIRVLRSHSLPNTNLYRPEMGYRYDGLYRISKWELLDAATQMHRFSLNRLPGQHSIRCQGVERRPTLEEIAHWKHVRSISGLNE